MKTSYFAHKEAISNPDSVAICRGVPSWFKGRIYSPLAPSWELLQQGKRSKIPPHVCALEYYKEVLSLLNPSQVYKDLGENAILLCWEKPGDFCHRRIVAVWLEKKLNVRVHELDYENLLFDDYDVDIETFLKTVL